MSQDKTQTGDEKNRSYVLQARDEQQQYSAALLRENEKLRATVATLESDHRRADEQHRAAVTELDRLRSRFHEVAQENERYAEQYHQIETHSSKLANPTWPRPLHSSVDASGAEHDPGDRHQLVGPSRWPCTSARLSLHFRSPSVRTRGRAA